VKADFDLSGKKILVTGASSGIGYETAKYLDGLGATLVLLARREDKLQALMSELNATRKHQYFSYDLANCDDLPRWMRTNLTELDSLVHCAGVHDTRPLRYIEEADIDKVFQINVKASFALVKGFCHKNVSSNTDDRRVVLLSSVAGLLGESGVSAYAASKGAVIALTKSLAHELAPKKIKVNCIAPAVIETDMTQALFSKMLPEQIQAIRSKHLLDLGKPIDVANAIAYLLVPGSRWITGTCLSVDGGYSA